LLVRRSIVGIVIRAPDVSRGSVDIEHWSPFLPGSPVEGLPRVLNVLHADTAWCYIAKYVEEEPRVRGGAPDPPRRPRAALAPPVRPGTQR
jgi:hypothetical protein